MPQEFMVLKCCECLMFQVHQVRKCKKWTCKICNKKQSQIKLFAKGSGKECREFVQALNMKKSEENELPLCEAMPVADKVDTDKCQVSATWEQFKSHEQDSTSSSDDCSTIDSEKWYGNKSTKRRKSSGMRNKKLKSCSITTGVKTNISKNILTEAYPHNLPDANAFKNLAVEKPTEMVAPKHIHNYNKDKQETNSSEVTTIKQTTSGKWTQFNPVTISSSSDSD